MLCFRVLTDYLHLLEDWKVRYAPKTPEEALDDRFVFSNLTADADNPSAPGNTAFHSPGTDGYRDALA